ncbi:nitronate monooxygenase family protein [Haloechinothrix sp. LS1_15]|uniref:NAD(P)H-dependent flavin oxidoreductase n=1 Tax=Haloechinothrix sp. LS1_15 TaxID=2652248 RepID=UPI002948A4CA|nr:nitronate monooxygenase family protein [Haloechinothrix sp. LS1_15]MDV6014148.1 nitronate monooxygenase [Haloechinothrix sp. LS1_15]
MRTALCDTLRIDYPIVGFTPSEHVAAAISRAGGLGVLGCVRFNDAEELDRVLDWMDANTGGKPYGVDIVMPSKVPTEGSMADLEKHIPDEHRAFVERTLQQLGVPDLPSRTDDAGVLGWLHSVARAHVDVALKHPISLIANALGSPPVDIITEAHEAGVKVAALAGKAEHAASHVASGVDIVVAQGYEAGGHTGEIASMVLLPEVAEQVGEQVPVLAAGGIGSGKQIAAALALGASGVWMGSYWLTTSEYLETMSSSHAMQQAMLGATSADTVRSRIFSGKPARLLKTRWTEAWSASDAPDPLPMPLQNLLVSEAHQRIAAAKDPSVVAMPVGQIVGRMNQVRPVADIMSDLIREFDEALSRLDKTR